MTDFFTDPLPAGLPEYHLGDLHRSGALRAATAPEIRKAILAFLRAPGRRALIAKGPGPAWIVQTGPLPGGARLMAAGPVNLIVAQGVPPADVRVISPGTQQEMSMGRIGGNVGYPGGVTTLVVNPANLAKFAPLEDHVELTYLLGEGGFTFGIRAQLYLSGIGSTERWQHFDRIRSDLPPAMAIRAICANAATRARYRDWMELYLHAVDDVRESGPFDENARRQLAEAVETILDIPLPAPTRQLLTAAAFAELQARHSQSSPAGPSTEVMPLVWALHEVATTRWMLANWVMEQARDALMSTELTSDQRWAINVRGEFGMPYDLDGLGEDVNFHNRDETNWISCVSAAVLARAAGAGDEIVLPESMRGRWDEIRARLGRPPTMTTDVRFVYDATFVKMLQRVPSQTWGVANSDLPTRAPFATFPEALPAPRVEDPNWMRAVHRGDDVDLLLLSELEYQAPPERRPLSQVGPPPPEDPDGLAGGPPRGTTPDPDDLAGPQGARPPREEPDRAPGASADGEHAGGPDRGEDDRTQRMVSRILQRVPDADGSVERVLTSALRDETVDPADRLDASTSRAVAASLRRLVRMEAAQLGADVAREREGPSGRGATLSAARAVVEAEVPASREVGAVVELHLHEGLRAGVVRAEQAEAEAEPDTRRASRESAPAPDRETLVSGLREVVDAGRRIVCALDPQVAREHIGEVPRESRVTAAEPKSVRSLERAEGRPVTDGRESFVDLMVRGDADLTDPFGFKYSSRDPEAGSRSARVTRDDAPIAGRTSRSLLVETPERGTGDDAPVVTRGARGGSASSTDEGGDEAVVPRASDRGVFQRSLPEAEGDPRSAEDGARVLPHEESSALLERITRTPVHERVGVDRGPQELD